MISEMRQVEINHVDSHTTEWGLLEFQGELKNSMPDEEIGQIQVHGKSASMIIGQHSLKGSVETLAKPFLVVEKEKGQMTVKGVIRKKVLFSDRPKPHAVTSS